MTAHLTSLENIPPKISVGLSGGPDSMALTHMLCHSNAQDVHALIIDHDLRPESAKEAEHVSNLVKDWPNLTVTILKWDAPKTQTKLMESAREARYKLFEDYCIQQQITDLYLAHHQDDQAETFLFRLSKGSGLDGLCGMQPQTTYSENLTLHRPLLATPKKDLIDYCQHNDITFVSDPSNNNESYMRPRLRKSRSILEEEGLTAKRLSVTAERLCRAQEALNWLTEDVWTKSTQENESEIILNLNIIEAYPSEIRLRLLQKAIRSFVKNRDYAPRLEKLENMAASLFKNSSFPKQTLAGLIFEKKSDKNSSFLRITREAA